MKTMEEINREIATLTEKLSAVKGTETEVYTRIVGYYRSIKNWNKGKRAEYSDRIPFALPCDCGKPETAATHEEENAVLV